MRATPRPGKTPLLPRSVAVAGTWTPPVQAPARTATG